MTTKKTKLPDAHGPPAWFTRVHRLAEERGIIKARLTEAAGVEPQRYHKWRDGSALHLEHAVALARYLNVSVDWIATGAAGPADAPDEGDFTQDERNLVWFLRSVELTPQDALKRLTAAQPGPARVVAVQGPYPVSRREPERDPADVDAPDMPSGVRGRVKRGG